MIYSVKKLLWSASIALVIGGLPLLTSCGDNPTKPNAFKQGAHALSTASTTTETVTGNGASASLSTVNGCVSNSIEVVAGMQVTSTSGGSTATTSADLTIASFDNCIGQNLGTISGTTPNVAFSGDLNSATLTGSLFTLDINNNARNVPVSLSWTRNGKCTKNNSVTKIVTGTVTTMIKTTDESCPASVTGTVDSLATSSSSALLFDNATITKTH
jgi:hypothetical protein